MDYLVLFISSLAIVVIATSLLILSLKKPRTSNRNLLVELLKESNQRNDRLTNLIVSRDFQTFAGLQSLSQNPPQVNQNQFQTPTSSSDYIPRDDITEAERLKRFGAAIGYGEVIYEEDPELSEVLRDMVAGGQIDMGEGVQ